VQAPPRSIPLGPGSNQQRERLLSHSVNSPLLIKITAKKKVNINKEKNKCLKIDCRGFSPPFIL